MSTYDPPARRTEAPRTTYTTAVVRVTDLVDGDVVRIDGAWRDVTETITDDDIDETRRHEMAEIYSHETTLLRLISERLGWAVPMWAVVRFIDHFNSNSDEIVHNARAFPLWDLVEIQVPVTTTKES